MWDKGARKSGGAQIRPPGKSKRMAMLWAASSARAAAMERGRARLRLLGGGCRARHVRPSREGESRMRGDAWWCSSRPGCPSICVRLVHRPPRSARAQPRTTAGTGRIGESWKWTHQPQKQKPGANHAERRTVVRKDDDGDGCGEDRMQVKWCPREQRARRRAGESGGSLGTSEEFAAKPSPRRTPRTRVGRDHSGTRQWSTQSCSSPPRPTALVLPDSWRRGTGDGYSRGNAVETRPVATLASAPSS